MKIVVLCAGFGSRLRPHTLTRPKPLLNVAGRPVLAHLLDKLLEVEAFPRFKGELEFIFVIGYLGEQLVNYVQTEYLETGRLRAQFVTQPVPLGSADAVWQAREAVFATASDPDLLLIYADTLFETDLLQLTTLPKGVDGILSYREADDIQNYGAIVMDQATGYAARLVEKPQTFVSRLAGVSPYYFSSAQKLYAAIAEQFARNQITKGEFYLTDAMQIMIESGAKFLPRQVSLWLDTGNFENLLESNRVLLDQSGATEVRSLGSSLIIEPCFIGEGVTLERSVIGPHVSLGSGAVIKDSILTDCIIEDLAQISNLSLRHSIIGRKAHLSQSGLTSLSLGDYSQLNEA